MKNKIRNKEVILGTMLSEIATPNILRVMHAGGLEFVIIDAEHGPFDFSQLANLVAVGNLIGLPTIIRIPEIRREWITKVLDMGADGMLVPMVNKPEEAKQIVEFAKYTPLGNRGVSTTRAHTNYNPGKLADYFEAANERTIILCQIETPEAVKNARAIAGVEGVDALIVGPSDLSTTHGFAGYRRAGSQEETAEHHRQLREIQLIKVRCQKYQGEVQNVQHCRQRRANSYNTDSSCRGHPVQCQLSLR